MEERFRSVVYDVEGTGPAEAASRARDMVLLLMVIASAFLFLAFSFNWEVNHSAFYVVRMSDVLRNLGPVESSIVALAVSAFVVSLPEIRKRLPVQLTPTYTVLIILGGLLLLYFIIGDLNIFLNVVIQTFVLTFYSAPLIFGLYGIIHHRPVHLVISAMFSFFIMGGAPRPPPGDWPMLLVCGVFFLLFVEVSDTSIRCWNFLETRKLRDEDVAGYANHYLRNLAVFVTGAFLLTIFILQLPSVVGGLGLKAMASSLELNSPYGQAASAVLVLGALGVLRFLHDRGYTKPWIRRWRRLSAYVQGAPPPVELVEKW